MNNAKSMDVFGMDEAEFKELLDEFWKADAEREAALRAQNEAGRSKHYDPSKSETENFLAAVRRGGEILKKDKGYTKFPPSKLNQNIKE
jgi:hypothetical protein